jgi:hypothetical protein
MTNKTCPTHGLTEHTDPHKNSPGFCKRCLASAVARDPRKFHLTPEFEQDLKPIRRRILSVVPR